MQVNIGKARLSIVHGDITTSGSQALTNAANNKLWMGGGVAGAIKKAGGEDVETEAMKKGPLPIGEVAVTGAGEMDADYVIHAVVMGQDLKTDADYIRKATVNAIKAADNLPVKTLSLPAFGTGVGHFPAEECSRLMVEVAVDSLLDTANLEEVKIVLKDEGMFEIFKRALEDKFHRR